MEKTEAEHLLEIAQNVRVAAIAYELAFGEWIIAGDEEKRASLAVQAASKKRDAAKSALDAAEECLLVAAGGKSKRKS